MTTDLPLPDPTLDPALKGHGFSRAEKDSQRFGASAPEVRPPIIFDPLADLRRRYPGHADEILLRLIPCPNDDDTRLYVKPDDSPNRRRNILETRNLLCISF